MCIVVALIVTQAEKNNLSSLLCDTSNITTINYSIFIEWNIIQHLTQIKELHAFAGCISEARFIWKKKLNMAKY